MLKCTELLWLIFWGFAVLFFFLFFFFVLGLFVYLVNCLVGFFCCLFFLVVVVLGFFFFFWLDWSKPRSAHRWDTILPLSLKESIKSWLDLGFESHLLCWRSRYHSGDLLLKEMILLLPVWWINEKNLWSCFWHPQHIIGLLHMLENLRPLPLNSSTY